MAPRRHGYRHGRRKNKSRSRKFTIGTIIKKVKLGESRSNKCLISNPRKILGAIYIPSSWGGTLLLIHPKNREVKLFYKDGTFPSSAKERIALIKELRRGLHEKTYQMSMMNTQTYWDIGSDKQGWYFYLVVGTHAASIKNEFIEEEKASKEPWNSWWWPHDDGLDPNMFDETVKYSASSPREPGPLRKYDDYVGNKTTTDSAWQWEHDHVRRPAGTGGTAGMCDASSMSGIEISRPKGTKLLKSPDGKVIKFREQDRLGLAAERYWIGLAGSTKINPADNNAFQLFLRSGSDLKADWFHKQLRRRFYINNKGLIVYVPNWNAGVYKYSAKFVAYGTGAEDIKKIKITNELTYKGWEKWVGPDETFSTTYSLEFNDKGDIVKEISWDPDDRPTRVHYSRPTAPLLNKKLDKKKLEEIIL